MGKLLAMHNLILVCRVGQVNENQAMSASLHNKVDVFETHP